MFYKKYLESILNLEALPITVLQESN